MRFYLRVVLVCSLIITGLKPMQAQCPFTVAIQSSNDITCNGGSDGNVNIGITGGVAPFIYSWNSGFYITQDLTNVPAGTYNLVVTDAAGCVVNFSTTLNEPTALTVTSTTVNPTCNSANGAPNGQISLTPSGGTLNPGAQYIVQWTPNVGAQVGLNVFNLAGGPAPFGFAYGFTVTDSRGCATTGQQALIQPNAISGVMSAIVPQQCFGQADGQATVTASGSNGGPFDFTWSSADATFNSLTSTATQLAGGSNSVTITEVGTGCQSVSLVNIPVATAVVATPVITNETCPGANNGIISVTPAGGTAPYDIQFFDALGTSLGVFAGQATASVNSLTPGNYIVSVADANGCNPVIHPISVAVAAADTFNIDSTFIQHVNCTGDNTGSITIVSTSSVPNNIQTPAVYQWSNGLFGPTISNLAAGFYDVTITTSPSGCTATASFQVNEPVFALRRPFCLADTVTCFGDSDGSVTVDTSLSYDGTPWVDGYEFAIDNQPFGTANVFNGLQSNYYTIFIKDSLGCVDSTEVFVSSPEPILIQTRPAYIELALGDTAHAEVLLQFTPTYPPLSIQWTPLVAIDCDTCTNVILDPVTDQVYTVTVTDSLGCQASDEVVVKVLPYRKVFIPTAFSPNGDDKNERFLVYGGVGVTRVLEFKVFDRFGSMVFANDDFLPSDFNAGWDGKVKGTLMNPGVYVYFARVLFDDGRELFYKGDVTLIR